MLFDIKRSIWITLLVLAMVSLIIFVVIFTTVLNIRAIPVEPLDPKAGCVIDLNNDLDFRHPLILKPKENSFLTPESNGLHLVKGEKLRIVCAGSNNAISISSNDKELELQCVNQNIFQTESGNTHPFKEFKCIGYPESIARKTGNKCSGKYTEVEIGFQISNGFIRLITTCLDDSKKDTLYSSYNLLHTINQQQIRVPRPNGFHEGSFYPGLDPSDLYTKKEQLKNFAKLLKSNELAAKYIKLNDDEFFLSRGHMTAKADFLYGSQQRATFYYVNVAPQWQVFNKENWNILEQDVRTFATKRELDLMVYTGMWGTATLPDSDNKPTPLHLYVNNNGNKFTVPEVYWKVLYDPETRKGVSFVGHNNPYEEDVAERTICKNICDKLNWLHWHASNITEGFSYCCEVNDLRKTVSYIPNITVNGLLT